MATIKSSKKAATTPTKKATTQSAQSAQSAVRRAKISTTEARAAVRKAVAQRTAATPSPAPVVKTVGQAIKEVMVDRNITSAVSPSIRGVDGNRYSISSFTEGTGARPVSDFQMDTLELNIAAKGGKE